MKKILKYSALIIIPAIFVFGFPDANQTFSDSAFGIILDVLMSGLFIGLIIYMIIKYRRTPKAELEKPKLYKVFFALVALWIISGIVILIMLNT